MDAESVAREMMTGDAVTGAAAGAASVTEFPAVEAVSGETAAGGSDPSTPLHARVAAYTRYAELAAAQLTALRNDDLDAFAVLSAQRDAIAAEIDAGPDFAALVESAHADFARADAPPAEIDQTSATRSQIDQTAAAHSKIDQTTASINAAVAHLVTQARTALAQGIADASAIEERLRTLRDNARSAIHEFEDRERALRQYLETDGAPAAALDISL